MIEVDLPASKAPLRSTLAMFPVSELARASKRGCRAVCGLQSLKAWRCMKLIFKFAMIAMY